jgi:homocysteine S-methyltransferase
VPALVDGPVVVLDGGMSNALEDRGHDLSDALWSARLLKDAPGEIAAVHRAYYEAGAAALREFHLPRLELLVAAGPDLLAVETIPDVDEAEVLVELLDELGFPAWLSYSIQGDQTRAGQPLADAVAARSKSIVAVGINCCAPTDVQAAVETAVAVTDKPAVAYPNSGEGWDAGGRRWTGGASDSTTLAQGWTAAGAKYVGGCCRVGPDDINALARTISRPLPGS